MFEPHEESWYSVNDTFYFDDLFDNKIIRTNKQIAYYNDTLTFDIEASSFDEDYEESYQDIDVYEYIKGTKIRINQKTYTDIPDLNSYRRQLFGRVWFSKTEGTPVDVFYEELNRYFPYHFPEDIINPSDQLERIIDVFLSNSPDKQDYDTKRALMYAWGLCINGRVIIGRTWEEFIELMHQISEHFGLNSKKRMLIYVHNLAYDIAFFLKLFKWEKIFAIQNRKPIFALTDLGIEFRCSFRLSNLSLENIGKSLTKYKVHKKVGDLDYRLIRHFKTPLSNKELRYLVNDCLCLACYIQECKEAEKNNITLIPLTATGYCRRLMSNKCLSAPGKQGQKEQFKKYHNFIKYLKINSMEEADLLHDAFMGGLCIAGNTFSTKIMYLVRSWDLASAYPAAMTLWDNYPMSKGTKVHIHNEAELKEYMELYCCVFDIQFINLNPKVTNMAYLSLSKCVDPEGQPFDDDKRKEFNVIVSNGRVVAADNITTSITDVDYEIISRVYSWSDAIIGTCYIYKRGRLPKEIVQATLELYRDKVSLKGLEDRIDFYNRQKAILNSCYGLMCQKIFQDIYIYDNDKGWKKEEHPDETDEEHEEKLLKKYNNSKKRFTFYPWALYVTANVRHTIAFAVLDGLDKGRDRFQYADTDSLKATHGDECEWYINRYNKMIAIMAEEAAAYYELPIEMFKPKTIKGKEKLIGIFENETSDGDWLAFRSLGSKRYLYMTHDHKVVLTVSGVNKKAALPYLIKKYGKYGLFCNFNEDLIVPAGQTGKLTHYYLDNKMVGEVTDYLGNTVKYVSESGIYMEDTSYSFSMEDAYLQYLRQLQGDIDYALL